MVELGKVIFRCTFSVLGRLRRWTSTRDTVEGPPKAMLSWGAQDTPLTCRQSCEGERKEGGREEGGREEGGREEGGERRGGHEVQF